MPPPFTQAVKELIRSIPAGKVATYGQIAACAGNHRAARQVAWILHACSEAEGLPWHRVIAGGGRISLPPGAGFELQQAALEAEGVEVRAGRADLRRYLWAALLEGRE